jgi:putative transposase
MVERGISQRRASALLRLARSSLRYQARLPARDASVIERMMHYAALYPRFGYRRIHIYLEREGFQLGWD